MPKPTVMHPSSRARHAWQSSLLLLAFVSSACALAVAPTERYLGTAYDSQGRELYTETHWSTGDAGEARHLILFTCPDGKAFARKRVEDAGQPLAPLFELDDGRYGYREGMRLDAEGEREVFVRRETSKPEQSAPVEAAPLLVVDAGFDRFILTHWDALLAGHEKKVDFLLPSRLRTYTFVLKPIGADQIDGLPVQRFRLELDSWFGFALPSIDMAYASDSKALREYSGVSNIRDNKGKNLKVRIEFPPGTRTADINPQALAAAETAPLDGQCKL